MDSGFYLCGGERIMINDLNLEYEYAIMTE